MRARLGAWVGAALSAVGVLGILIAAVLLGIGLVRLWTPGRPWFESRGRVADAIVYVILAAIIWYLAPYVATMAVR